MRSFGTLKWSQWARKKSSEELRSSSIDGSCQMVRTGTIKLKKSQYVFGFWDRFVNVLLLTVEFLVFLLPRRLSKIKFRFQKSIFIKILIKNIFLSFLTIFVENEKIRFAQKWTKKINCDPNVKKTCLGILFLVVFE